MHSNWVAINYDELLNFFLQLQKRKSGRASGFGNPKLTSSSCSEGFFLAA